MGTIQRLAIELATLPGRRRSILGRQLSRWARGRARELRSEELAVVRTGSEQIGRRYRILTISHSSVVRSLLERRSRKRPRVQVRVLRSLPGSEALDLARRLHRAGVPVVVVPDSGAVRALADTELVLVGADTIYRDGSLLHKRGTRRLARAARRAGVPVYVLAGAMKQVPIAAPRAVGRLRGYDLTPAGLVTEFWTEAGAFSPSQLRGRVRRASPETR